MIKHTANEAFYSYVVWAISIFGAVGTYVFLNALFVLSAAVFAVYAAMIMFFCHRISKVRSNEDKVYSFSRPPHQALGDILMKTIETSFLSIVLDLAAKDVTPEQIFSRITLVVSEVTNDGHVQNATVEITAWEPKLTVVVLVFQLLMFLGVMLGIYSGQAGKERANDG